MWVASPTAHLPGSDTPAAVPCTAKESASDAYVGRIGKANLSRVGKRLGGEHAPGRDRAEEGDAGVTSPGHRHLDGTTWPVHERSGERGEITDGGILIEPTGIHLGQLEVRGPGVPQPPPCPIFVLKLGRRLQPSHRSVERRASERPPKAGKGAQRDRVDRRSAAERAACL